ncbi:hypothetical protein ACFQ15_02530 [Sphingomonas hankookensis]|uniref:hypothetical protein n=1 Tax=Sphingomonas hankookensis TaxID=563996 RepID=UPI001F56D3A6|nr:hypothetical protein [Sphingomonas hankookensis]
MLSTAAVSRRFCPSALFSEARNPVTTISPSSTCAGVAVSPLVSVGTSCAAAGIAMARTSASATTDVEYKAVRDTVKYPLPANPHLFHNMVLKPTL